MKRQTDNRQTGTVDLIFRTLRVMKRPENMEIVSLRSEYNGNAETEVLFFHILGDMNRRKNILLTKNTTQTLSKATKMRHYNPTAAVYFS